MPQCRGTHGIGFRAGPEALATANRRCRVCLFLRADTFVVVMLLALMYYAAVFSPHFVRGIVNSAQA